MMTAVMNMIFLRHAEAMQRVKPPDVVKGCCGGCREVVVCGVGARVWKSGGAVFVSDNRWVGEYSGTAWVREFGNGRNIYMGV